MEIISARAVDWGDSVFRVVAETEDGARYEHPAAFDGSDGGERAEVFAARVQNAGAINSLLWMEFEPVYGSKAYHRQGVEISRWADERREAAYGEP